MNSTAAQFAKGLYTAKLQVNLSTNALTVTCKGPLGYANTVTITQGTPAQAMNTATAYFNRYARNGWTQV